MVRKIQSARKGMTSPTAAPPPVHVQFQQQAERTPDAIALSWGGQELTYAQLEGRANQLARHLQNLGVGPEITVGISVDRSADMIVAVLGVLKAGGAYVPLDPAYPPDRLAAMIEDSGIRVLITREHIAGSLPDNVPATVLMDSQWHEIAAGSALGVASSVKPENLAYIIYTSGSTGKPKGVMIEHHSLAAYVASAAPLLRFGPADRVLQFASLNFDASAEEIYCTLLAGGTLVLRSEAMLASTADFLKTVQDWRITVLDLPTAFWHMLAVDMSRQKLRLPQDVRQVIIGGERALPDRLSLWESCVGMGVSLLNGYGPTETTIASTMWKPDRSGQAQGASVPIGKPLNGVHAYVVDSSGKLAGEGSVGELWLGGFGVARGYLNQPAMTAQKFVPDPFGGGGRIYKSGDMVRRLPDGNLEFVGRVDHQVKVRGFRIELGEIESALNALESVRESVVTAKTGPAADTRLVAYIVPSRPDFRAGEIRQSLKGKLPEYMIPSAFVVLDAMPLGPTGKIDRAALPEPSRDARDRETPLVPPSTPAQEKLAAMWCELLGMDQVSIHDPFLELGGHSLLAAQLIARVRDQFDVDLTLRAVFDYPTVAAMAEHIERERVHAHGAAGPASMRAPRGGDLPLSFAQEAVWFFLRLHPVNVAYNSQAYLRMHGTLDAGALQRVLELLRRR